MIWLQGQDNGTVIYTCKATAVTKGASIDYSFVSSSDPDIAALFSINRQNCEIKLEKKPDREFREIYDVSLITVSNQEFREFFDILVHETCQTPAYLNLSNCMNTP